MEMTFDEKYVFTSKAKRNLLIIFVAGIVLLAVGIFMNMGGGHEAADAGHASVSATENLMASSDASAAAEGGEHHGTATWLKRVYTSLWINNIYFVGLGIIGVFFFAIQYASSSFWSTAMLRVAMAMGNWLPIALVLMLGVFFIAGHDLFHWTHSYLMDPNDPQYDPIIAGKEPYLNTPFWLARMVVFIGAWSVFFNYMRKHSLAEDLEPAGTTRWKKIRSSSAWFLVFFAVSSSMSAWDWVLSIDTHWFSTLFGWYVFSSWWVTGLAFITFMIIVLKEQGYLKIINANHLHDLGKFIFGFSIFWTYLWFSQFMLIYYSNIPEEAIYYWERLNTPQYRPVFYINLLINFFFPFLALMTRDSKRFMGTLKNVTVVVMLGHWIDFYLMITPGVMKYDGGLGFIEIGSTLIFLAAFVWVFKSSLAKYPLIAKNHPTLQESLHHHI
jgi:hypothetical protein